MTNTTDGKASETGDIFNAIAKRDAAVKPGKVRPVKMHYVCVGSYERSHTRRVYTSAQARRAARLAKRLGMQDVYVSSPAIRNV